MRSGLKILEEFILALIREFLGADSVSVGLSYDVNLKWHMPICAEICGVEQKYMPFLGSSPSAISEIIQSTETYAN